MTSDCHYDIVNELPLMSDNSTLTNKQQCNPENSLRFSENKNLNRKIKFGTEIASSDFWDKDNFFYESSILAQDERWRRA